MGKQLCYHAGDRGSIPRGGHNKQMSICPRAASPTQCSIFLSLVKDYWIILGPTPGHQ